MSDTRRRNGKGIHGWTEGDFESRLHHALREAFPWLSSNAIRHQTNFYVTLGTRKLRVGASTTSRAKARADVLLLHAERPLAVLELKRPGAGIIKADKDQVLSYARLVQPIAPLAVVSDGSEICVLDTYSGRQWTPQTRDEAAFNRLLEASHKVAAADLDEAVSILLGPEQDVWQTAIRAVTADGIESLTGDLDNFALPFANKLAFPREASQQIIDALDGGRRVVLLTGAPLSGKTCVMREVATSLNMRPDGAALFLEQGAGDGIFRRVSNVLGNALGWHVTPEQARSWLLKLSDPSSPKLVLMLDGLSVGSAAESDLREIARGTFGMGLRAVLAEQQSVLDALTTLPKRKQQTELGRVAPTVVVQDLTNEEFTKTEQLFLERGLQLMHGARAAQEYRSPWVLRAISSVTAEKISATRSDTLTIAPPLLGPDLLALVRSKIETEELAYVHGRLAEAVLEDIDDSFRSDARILRGLRLFLIPQTVARAQIGEQELLELQSSGILRLTQLANREMAFACKFQHVLASELSYAIARRIVARLKNDDINGAVEYLVQKTELLPFGDVIGARAVLDLEACGGIVTTEFLNALLRLEPQLTYTQPGGRYAVDAGERVIEMVAKGRGSVLIGRTQPWLILSHLLAFDLMDDADLDLKTWRLHMLQTLGAFNYVLRRVDNEQLHTHDVHGATIVCGDMGIIEPITFALFTFFKRHFGATEAWIRSLNSQTPLALLNRVDTILRNSEHDVNVQFAMGSARMREEVIAPALSTLLATGKGQS